MNKQQAGQSEKQEEEVTGLVCLEADLQDGQMREVAVDDQKVLLVRIQGQYSAVGSRCSHYSAPLIKGALVGDRVRCPFHGACFNVRTGDIEEYPGLDSIPCYKVKVEDGKVYVTINKKSLTLTKRVKEMCAIQPGTKHTVLLIGGGPASLVCAETLRQNCYPGHIVIVTKDSLPPIDKPKLSKAMNLESSSILLRSAGSKVAVDSGKAVIVDKYMRTNIPDIFSAGDVTSFPLSIRGDQQVNIGHWQMSHSHGKVAALNMLKKPTKIESVPFFWSALAGKSIRYTGYGEGYTEIIVKGKVEERKFLAFYIKDEEVVAAASLMFDPAVAQVAELMAEGKNITKKQAQSDDLSWLQM
uniref:Rieske domain-containing protein n=1 Tax=Nothobranchius pienaari TaxID=704102 RepID=A0A1A8R6L5_9TELE